jgi:hypothetical protein
MIPGGSASSQGGGAASEVTQAEPGHQGYGFSPKNFEALCAKEREKKKEQSARVLEGKGLRRVSLGRTDDTKTNVVVAGDRKRVVETGGAAEPQT